MIDFSKILFLDIETVSHEKSFDQLSERMQKLWAHKAEQIGKGDENATPESLYDRAAIYAEFGKIVCISVGFFNDQRFRLKSFYGHDEKKLLADFARRHGVKGVRLVDVRKALLPQFRESVDVCGNLLHA